MLPVIILAGGLATRLGSIAQVKPKSMVSINGRPFIDYQLKNLKLQGVSDVVLCTGHMGDQIEDYVSDGSRWGIRVTYSYDGNTLLGTGGALKKASEILNSDFALIYGDSFLTIDMQLVEKKFNECCESVLMTVYKNRHQYDKSNVQFQNGKIKKYCKRDPGQRMEYIDYGLMIFSAGYFNSLHFPTAFDLSDFLEGISINDEIHGYLVESRFFEVGSLNGINDFESYILEGGRLWNT